MVACILDLDQYECFVLSSLRTYLTFYLEDREGNSAHARSWPSQASKIFSIFQSPEKNSEKRLDCDKTLEGGSSEAVKMDNACSNLSKCAANPRWAVPDMDTGKPIPNEKCESRFLSGASCELKEDLLSFTPRRILSTMTAVSCEIISVTTNMVSVESARLPEQCTCKILAISSEQNLLHLPIA